MIQRIQTLYLLGSAICLSIVLLVKNSIMDFLSTSSVERYHFTLYGIYNQEKMPLDSSFNLPFYLAAFILIGLIIFSIFSYKNLNRQSLLIKISIVLYSLLILGLVAIFFLNDIKIENVAANVIIGPGFYIIGMGLPLLFFANNGIKRDKNLLDSLNRLR